MFTNFCLLVHPHEKNVKILANKVKAMLGVKRIFTISEGWHACFADLETPKKLNISALKGCWCQQRPMF
jgi:hypothetical protein